MNTKRGAVVGGAGLTSYGLRSAPDFPLDPFIQRGEMGRLARSF